MKDNTAAEYIPSFSRFKFHFCPKDATTNTAMNYTGRLKVKYLMQQRMIRKKHDDDHHCAAILRERSNSSLVMYTDGGPEHSSTVLSVKIALIALQRWLNLDRITAARTAPGHSYKKTAEKINCILNIGLYGIGCMRQPCPDVEFERKLQDVRKAINGLPGNRKVFEDTCAPSIDLIDTF